MKKIEVMIRPFELDQLKEALSELGIPGMTVSEVQCPGHGSDERRVYRGQPYAVDPAALKIEIVTSDDEVPDIVEAIRHAVVGEPAERACILVTEIEEAIRIRTGESGEGVLFRWGFSRPAKRHLVSR